MILLLALALMQFREAPDFVSHLQNGLDRARLIQHVGEHSHKPDYAGIGARSWFCVDVVGLASRHASQAIAFPIVQDSTSLVDDRLDPNGRPTDVSQRQPDVSASGSSGVHRDVTSFQVLHSADGARGVTGSQSGDDQPDRGQQDAHGGDEGAQQRRAEARDRDPIGGRDSFYSRPLSTQVGILATVGALASCAIFAGLLQLCLGRGWSQSTKVNTVYGGIVAVIGLLLLAEVFYLSIADVAG